jgi:hypothetical protein
LKNIFLELTGIFKEIPGGNVKIPKGFSKVANCLRNEMPKNTIKFGKVVSAIPSGGVLLQTHSTPVLFCHR